MDKSLWICTRYIITEKINIISRCSANGKQYFVTIAQVDDL